MPNGITFNTQSQIDSFQINYPGCTEIEGGVWIEGNDITNLNGLSVLTSFGDYLWIIKNDSLSSLTGLENVISIEGHLGIQSNDMLVGLSGLDNLTSVGGDLYISDNEVLINLTGLNNIITIGGGLCISFNDALSNLAGLDNLTSIGGGLTIETNNVIINLTGLNNLTTIGGDILIFEGSLTNLTGLENVTSIGGGLDILYAWALTSLTGLDNVNSLGGGINIANNGVLSSLTGLEGITSIEGNLGIINNDYLTSLTGLDNIEANTISDLYIFENSSLSTCDVQSICDYLAAPNGTVEIHDNAAGCDSQEEVEEACGVGIKENSLVDICAIFPNPFSGETTFSIDLKEPTQVKLIVMDSFGRMVATIVNESLGKGDHHITWNAEGLPSGIYFYRLTTGSQYNSGKLVVVR